MDNTRGAPFMPAPWDGRCVQSVTLSDGSHQFAHPFEEAITRLEFEPWMLRPEGTDAALNAAAPPAVDASRIAEGGGGSRGENWTWTDSADALAAMAARLTSCRWLALDLEHHLWRSDAQVVRAHRSECVSRARGIALSAGHDRVRRQWRRLPRRAALLGRLELSLIFCAGRTLSIVC